MRYKRFFAFGCSFTRYYWPTWADFIGLVHPEYYNYGGPGRGNTFIAHQIMRASEYHKFNKDDLVIVAWTSPLRFDINNELNKNIWQTDIVNLKYGFDRKIDNRNKLVKTVVSDQTLITNTIQNIISTYYLLSHLGVNYYFTGMTDMINYDLLAEPGELFFEILSKPKWINNISYYYSGETNKNNRKYLTDYFGGKIQDGHPCPMDHFDFVKDQILNNLELSDNELKLLNEKANNWQTIYHDENNNSRSKFLEIFKSTFATIRSNTSELNDVHKYALHNGMTY